MIQKSEFDKFYTKECVVRELLKYIPCDGYDLVIEPSAGNGAFSKNISCKKIISLDLMPEADFIIKQNWLEFEVPNDNKILIIGNPPFGTRNNLSKKFINHCLQFNNIKTIAFILPNVFNKHTNQKLFSNEWKLQNVIKLPINSFLLNNQEYNVPCSFYIWTKLEVSKDLRFDEKKYLSHKDFYFTTKDKCDFFILGASPKKIKLPSDVNKNNRGYYIKSNIDLIKLKENFISIKWVEYSNSSANGGVAWFTKPELIKAYSENHP